MCAEKRRPTRAEVQAAAGKTLPDVLAPNLKLWFVGINPGLYTAAVGYHFARPGNRFWPALELAGFTPRQLAPHEQARLLDYGYGITNVVARASAGEGDLSEAELVAGGRALEEKVRRLRPRMLVFLGIGAYRKAFGRPKAAVGRQEETIGGVPVWVLPNPSGLNANYQLDDLARLLEEVRLAAEDEGEGRARPSG